MEACYVRNVTYCTTFWYVAGLIDRGKRMSKFWLINLYAAYEKRS